MEAFSSLATAVETPVFATVICERLVEIPTTVVDSEVERLVKALRPEETWALVGDAPSATIVEMAVEKRTASEVVPERLVLSRVAPERAVETTTPAEVVVDSAAEVIPDREVWVDLAVLDEVEIAVLRDVPEDTCVVCEVCAERRLETVDERELSVPSTVDTEGVIVRPPGSDPFRTFVWG